MNEQNDITQISGDNNENDHHFISVKDCEDAINKVGSNGKFQKIAFLLLIICYTCTGSFITNSFIFLEKDPEITCQSKNTTTNETIHNYTCTRKDACSI